MATLNTGTCHWKGCKRRAEYVYEPRPGPMELCDLHHSRLLRTKWGPEAVYGNPVKSGRGRADEGSGGGKETANG